jgi:hypothetical protein
MAIDQKFAILSGLGVHLVTNLFEYALGIGSLLILAAPLIRQAKRPPHPEDAGEEDAG